MYENIRKKCEKKEKEKRKNYLLKGEIVLWQ